MKGCAVLAAVVCTLFLLQPALGQNATSSTTAVKAEAAQKTGSGVELLTQLKKAEDAQENREEEVVPVVAEVVKEAPEAELANGDGDVSTVGNAITFARFHIRLTVKALLTHV